MITSEENEPQPLRIIGIPKRRNGKYVLDEYAILNRECGWICPRCNEEVRITPVQAGEQTFVCKKCNASFTVRVDANATTFMLDKKKASPTPVRSGGAPASGAAKSVASAAAVHAAAGVAVKGVTGIAAAIVAPQQASKPARGMLLTPDERDLKKPFTPKTPSRDERAETPPCDERAETPSCDVSPTTGSLQWGGFFSRKHYQLLTGSNIIGRKDKKTPSDVEFDDPEMSRRSVRIDVLPDGQGGFSYTLTVMKALNPVMVNDRQVGLAENVVLKHNDVLTMGKTSMTLKIEH